MVRKEGKKSIEIFFICCFMCMLKRVKMGVKKLQQSLLTTLFKTITREEQEEVEELCNESSNQDDSILPKSVKKHPIGCLRKFVATLQFERQIKKRGQQQGKCRQSRRKQAQK